MTTRDLLEKVVLVRGDTERRIPGETAGRSGWHAAWTHGSDSSRPDVLARCLDAGLTGGDRLAWIAPPERLQVVPRQLRRLEFVDASGLRAIAGVTRALVEMHRKARLVGASSMSVKVWSLVGFDRTPTDVEVVPA